VKTEATFCSVKLESREIASKVDKSKKEKFWQVSFGLLDDATGEVMMLRAPLVPEADGEPKVHKIKVGEKCVVQLRVDRGDYSDTLTVKMITTVEGTPLVTFSTTPVVVAKA